MRNVPAHRKRRPRAVSPLAAFFVSLLLCGLVGGGVPASAHAQAPITQDDTDASLGLPPVTADAVYVADLTADVELYALASDERLAPGSTTKIATALVVVAQVELDDTVVIQPSDIVDGDVYSSMNLVPGDTLTVEQLLYGLLIPSGNDAAYALARYVGAQIGGGNGDPTAAFVAAMNELVASLGLENTQFQNPEGNDAEGHYSSARDLAVLAEELLRHETLATIVQTQYFEVVSIGLQKVYPLPNSNTLLEEEGVIGVKTGTTPDAGGCLITVKIVNGGDNRIVTVVLGSDIEVDETGTRTVDTRYDDTRSLYLSVDDAFDWVQPDENGAIPGLTDELSAWDVSLQDAPAIPVPADESDFSYQLVLSPAGPPGEQVGRLLLFIGSVQVGELPVYQGSSTVAGALSGRVAA